MSDLLFFSALVLIVFAGWYFFVSRSERQILSEMSDACIGAYAMWEDDGTPANAYAEEHDRRKLATKRNVLAHHAPPG